ncbi:hypothetical protein IJD15_04880 [bacterium]|nr:hypothetical protein [bacterium]
MNKVFSLLFSMILFSSLSTFAFERDTFIEESLENQNIEKPIQNLKYDYTAVDKIPIKLQIQTPITTKNDSIVEGQLIDFVVREDVKYNHRVVIPKGTKATAVIQTYQSRGMNGIPAIIVLDDFEIPNLDKSKLKDDYIKRGQDRSYIVFPIKWALTLIPFAGYSTNLILGGHAHIKKKHNVIIYYYPKWAEN